MIRFWVIICPGITPITTSDAGLDFGFAGIVNIFGSSNAFIFIVFFCRMEDDDEESVFFLLLLLTPIPIVCFLILSPILVLLLLSIFFPQRKTSDILKESKSSNNTKSALKPGAIAPMSFSPKYLAVLIDAISIA